MVEATSGHSLNTGLRKDRDSKLVVYAAMKQRLPFPTLGGTTVFKSGSTNHVSRLVAVSYCLVASCRYLFASFSNVWTYGELSHISIDIVCLLYYR
jgi:hypothetical protein